MYWYYSNLLVVLAMNPSRGAHARAPRAPHLERYEDQSGVFIKLLQGESRKFIGRVDPKWQFEKNTKPIFYRKLKV